MQRGLARHSKTDGAELASGYLSLPEASAQTVAGVLLVLQPLQISLQTLFGHLHALKEVCRLRARFQ